MADSGSGWYESIILVDSNLAIIKLDDVDVMGG
jgi:hypothetical protein